MDELVYLSSQEGRNLQVALVNHVRGPGLARREQFPPAVGEGIGDARQFLDVADFRERLFDAGGNHRHPDRVVQ